MVEITFVCCYNDKESFDSLKKNIKEQSCEAEIIGIDNRNGFYKSCSSALNSVMSSVKTKYVAFIHQDIFFIQADTVRNIINYLDKVNEIDIIGVAGAKEGGKYNRKVLSNIIHGNKKEAAGDCFKGMEKCMTLDECLVFGYTNYFMSNPFDEVLCDNWHLYVVEQCLRTLVKGGQVYVCDIKLWHKSKGNVRSNYVMGFYKLCKKYRKNYEYITTCCATSRTAFPYLQKSCLIMEGSIFKRHVLKIKK